MSTLSRYTAKELLAHVGGVLVIVLGIFLVRRLGSLLGVAADGSVTIQVVFHLLGLRTIMALPSLLPVVLYLAVLLALGRLYRDEEMTALAACGVAPLRVQTIVFTLSLLAALLVGALAFSVRPWAAARYEGVRDSAKAGLELGSMSPGRFYEIQSEGEQIVFSEGRAPREPEVMEHLFVQERKDDLITILVAARAIEHRNPRRGERILRLLDGHRYDIGSGEGNLQITRYEELEIRTPLGGAVEEDGQDRSRGTLALLGSDDPRDAAELQWRLAMPVSTILLMMLAIPFSRVNPRGGRYPRLILAILLYLAYRQLLGVMKSWVGDGIVPPFPGVWMIHGACLAGVVALLLMDGRQSNPGPSRR